MFGHRNRQHFHAQPPAPTNPYALAAARASTPNPRAQTPTLSQSAAAAALHTTPITNTSPANVVTKRMERRNSQTSLQRRGSESSMSERIGWLRESASPERRPESRDSYTPSRPKSLSTSRTSRGDRDIDRHREGAGASVRKSNSRHEGLAQSIHAPRKPPSVTSSPQKNKSAAPRSNTRQNQQKSQYGGYDHVPDTHGHRDVDYYDDSGDPASPTLLPSTLRGNAGLKASMHAPQNTNRARQQQQQQQQQHGANSQSFTSRLKAGTMRTGGGMDYDNQHYHQQQHHGSDFRASGGCSGAPPHQTTSSSGVPDVSEQAKVLAREIMRQQMLLEQRKKASGESTTTTTTSQTAKKKKKSKGKKVSQGNDDDLGQLDSMDPHYAASVSSVGSWASDLHSIPEERNDINDREGGAKTLRKRRGRGTFTDRVTPGREGIPDLPTIPSLGDLEDDNQKKRQETFDQMAVEQRPYRTGSDAKIAAPKQQQQQQQPKRSNSGINKAQASQKPLPAPKANEKKELEHPAEQVPSPPDSPLMPSRPFIRTIPATPPAANMENPIVSPPTSTSETEGAGGLHAERKRSVDRHSPSRGGSLSLKHHSPPPRSLSAVKSALKGGSSGSLSNHGEMSDNSSILSTEDGNRRRSASRKRNVRVSFSEENDVVEMPEDEYLYSPITQEHDVHKKYSAVKADHKHQEMDTDETTRKGIRDVSFNRVNRASDAPSDDRVAKEGLAHDSEPYQVSDLDSSEDEKPVQKPSDPSTKSTTGDIETTESTTIGKVEAPQLAPTVHLNNGAAASPEANNMREVTTTRSAMEPITRESKQKLFGGLLDMPGLFPGTPMETGTPPTEYPLSDTAPITLPPTTTTAIATALAPAVAISSLAPSTPESHADEDSDSGDSIYSDAFEAFGTGPASPKRREGKRTLSADTSDGIILQNTTAAANGGGVKLSTSDEEEPQHAPKPQKTQKIRKKTLRGDVNGNAIQDPQPSPISRPSEALRRTVSNSSSSSSSSRVSGSSFKREFSGGGGRGRKGVSKLRTSMREPGAAESRAANGANSGEGFTSFKKGASASRWATSTNSTPEKADKSSFQSGFRGRESGTQSKGLFGMRRGSKQREYSPDSSDNEARRKIGKASVKRASTESRGFFGRGSMRSSIHAPAAGNDSSRKQTGGWQSRFADSSDEEGEDLVTRRNRLGRTLSPDSSTSSPGDGHAGRDSVQFRHPDANKSLTDPNMGKSDSKKRWWSLGSKKGKQSKDAARPLSAGAPQPSGSSERPTLGKRRETDPETSGGKGSSSRNSFRLSGRMSFDKHGRGGGGEGGESHTARMDRLDEQNEEFPGGEQFYTDKKPKKFPKLRKMFGIKD